uniref:Uncharacterized protein n=1 Tax=Arundo donax TaxID=35708 RepID=A0A0A9GZZ2_ARUDO
MWVNSGTSKGDSGDYQNFSLTLHELKEMSLKPSYADTRV